LENSLGLVGTEFNWSVSITYFAVTAGLLPSNILMKKISAKYFFPIVMVTWGIIVMCIAAVKNAPGLLTARFFLGIPEAGVVPACVMYFSMWYKPSERALRIAIFHSANSLAQAVSAFIAGGLAHLQGSHGLNAWQWVFIIEGALPIAMSIPLFFLLLTFPETSTALSERERFIAINRLGARGATRKTDVTWSWPAFVRIFTRPSTYIFFISYVSLCIVAVAQATFLPTILRVFLKFGTTKANLYTAICNLVSIPIYWIVGVHSDWTRERMWHYLIPVVCAVPCYGVWTYVGTNPESRGTTISTLALYGMAFLGQMILVSQPIVLSYRSSTLYGASEQAVGGAAAVASLSIASIIAPQVRFIGPHCRYSVNSLQMYPNNDGPNYIAGFSGTCALLAVCILSYLTLPLWLLREANARKKKTGHALPLQAMEDAENSQVSAEAHARIHEINAREEQAAFKNEEMKLDVAEEGSADHVEAVREK
jgi:MFS family permease